VWPQKVWPSASLSRAVSKLAAEVGVSVGLPDDLRQVGAGGETASLAPHHDAADSCVFRGATERTVELIVHRAIEGVELLRAI
jgi:hypothetical protein